MNSIQDVRPPVTSVDLNNGLAYLSKMKEKAILQLFKAYGAVICGYQVEPEGLWLKDQRDVGLNRPLNFKGGDDIHNFKVTFIPKED